MEDETKKDDAPVNDRVRYNKTTGDAEVSLIKPIKVGDHHVSGITMRPMQIGDIVAVQKLGDDDAILSHMVLIIARTSGLTVEQVELLSLPDWKSAQGVVLPQLGKFEEEMEEENG